MYDGMGETYGIRVLYSGLESRRYIALSSCQFFLLLLRQCLRKKIFTSARALESKAPA